MTNVINFDRAAMLKAALDYARLGWHVFPTYGIRQLDDGRYQCRCGDDECKSPGKHPYHKLAPQGHHSATTDEATIRKWFSGEHKLNLAISLEHSNLVAVDIDPRNGGLYTMEALEAKHGDLISDVLQLTAGGGEHRVFSMPKNMGHLPGKLGKGVDLKANGYIVSWPSFGISGIQYGWEASSDPFAGAIPSPLPDWIRDLAFDRIELNHQPGSRFVTPEQISELQSALAFLSADDYHQWVNFGNALKSIGVAGYQLWDEWSRRSDKYDANQMGHKWRSFKTGTYNKDDFNVYVSKTQLFNVLKLKWWVHNRLIELGLLPPKTGVSESKGAPSPDNNFNFRPEMKQFWFEISDPDLFYDGQHSWELDQGRLRTDFPNGSYLEWLIEGYIMQHRLAHYGFGNAAVINPKPTSKELVFMFNPKKGLPDTKKMKLYGLRPLFFGPSDAE
jgi:hypothetical protein